MLLLYVEATIAACKTQIVGTKKQAVSSCLSSSSSLLLCLCQQQAKKGKKQFPEIPSVSQSDVCSPKFFPSSSSTPLPPVVLLLLSCCLHSPWYAFPFLSILNVKIYLLAEIISSDFLQLGFSRAFYGQRRQLIIGLVLCMVHVNWVSVGIKNVRKIKVNVETRYST